MTRRFHLLLLLALAACADPTRVTPATYADLAGWGQDTHAAPFALFLDSCRANETRATAYQSGREGAIGIREDWQRACDEAAALGEPDDAAARAFFEQHFTPYKVETEKQPEGLITGYYEPLLHGSRSRSAKFSTPVYGVPDDLAIRKPYFTRAEIDAGEMGEHAPVLLYVDDPVALFFLHIQGSGKVQLAEGGMVGLQYAAQNGHDYVAIGRVLKERGELSEVSMQTIRDWLAAHPNERAEVMEQNPAFVFFTLNGGDKPAKGALGLPLTALRSLAVDDDRAAYGVPTYLDTTYLDTTQPEYPTGNPLPLRRLFVSQDTGGALHGPHRGDIFYGQGDQAAWQAGQQNSRAKIYWLLPVSAPAEIAAPEAAAQP